jgi:hypothetical protein
MLGVMLSEFEDYRARAAEYQAFDRRRIAALERGKIQPARKDRGEVLKALLAANGGKMFAKDARQQMRLPENVFSELLKTHKDSILARHFHLLRLKLFRTCLLPMLTDRSSISCSHITSKSSNQSAHGI